MHSSQSNVPGNLNIKNIIYKANLCYSIHGENMISFIITLFLPWQPQLDCLVSILIIGERWQIQDGEEKEEAKSKRLFPG